MMDLKAGSGSDYLSWGDFRFGSDSILISFRYERCRSLLKEVAEAVGDYKAFVEKYLRWMYTIGGTIIFPKHPNSINQTRGTNPLICDRWDLTLECIRRYYAGEDSPLHSVLKSDQAFFDLFNDFKGYVDYFFLQDCVSEDYSSVDVWMGDGNLTSDPLPQSVNEYLRWIRTEFEFLVKRNNRISQFLDRKPSE